MLKRYIFGELPSDLETLIFRMVYKFVERPGTISVYLGEVTKFLYSTYPGTTVQLGMDDLLRYSRETIPFKNIPIIINRPDLLEILKISLEKRLQEGY